MPPPEDGAALKPDEIDLLRRWINQGAVAPDEPVPSAPSEHWAFRRIERPPVPESKFDNPIDRFLDAKRRQHNLVPQPKADRSILIRRLYLDLIGLPPSLDQLHDDRPWNQIVDELLVSKHHGERWGRHWMDIWRYSDWYGLGQQLRNSQKHMWHWRDWIIESLNADKGYDQMIREMLAGDELAPENLDTLRATGFLARNYYLFNRTTWLDSTIEHTGKAFLGLTLNCAKCHDHKYDPITHEDYYSFRAIFEPHQVRLDPVPGTMDFEKDGLPRVFDDHVDAKTFLHLRGDPRNPDKQTKIGPRVPSLFASFQPKITKQSLPAFAFAPSTREYFQRESLSAAIARTDDARQRLKKAEAELAASSTGTPKPTTPGSFVFHNNFNALDKDAWELVGKGWQFADGQLVQTRATRDREFIRLKRELPRDFELTCRYTTTGGTTYKSVTFRFDESPDGKFDNFIYTSAHAPGPKVQAAYTRNGQNVYPPQGRRQKNIRVGRAYELRIAVRDRLANVWLDNEFILAYVFPSRKNGTLSLSGFDATVAFDAIAIQSLPPTTKLKPMNGDVGKSPGTPQQQLKISKLRLAASEAEVDYLRAIFDADRAKYEENPRTEELAIRASNAEVAYLTALAAFEAAAANGDANKIKAAEGKQQRAEQLIAATKKGKATYTSIRASRKALETPAHKEADYAPTYSRVTTGRRTALAKWITSRDNPLTARVAVNHVWTRHFGEPLVESVFDFGLRAKRPEHAALLDYLSAEFISTGWSFRKLHRLIVNSKAYQLSSSTRAANSQTLDADSGNRFYWRMNARRMESQVVRDSLLHLAGTLDPTLGGRPLPVGDKSRRRSIYFRHSRDQQDKFLSMFDDADLLQCYRRSESIVPQQALALANSKLSLNMADEIAKRFTSLHAERQPFIEHAFETLLARTPNTDELAACLEYMEKRIAKITGSAKDAEQRARSGLIHALLNHNDFVSIR